MDPAPIDPIGSGLRGLRAAGERLDRAAREIADFGPRALAAVPVAEEIPGAPVAPGPAAATSPPAAFRPEPPFPDPAPSLARSLVDQRLALFQGRAAIRALEAGLGAERSLLDVVA